MDVSLVQLVSLFTRTAFLHLARSITCLATCFYIMDIPFKTVSWCSDALIPVSFLLYIYVERLIEVVEFEFHITLCIIHVVSLTRKLVIVI